MVIARNTTAGSSPVGEKSGGRRLGPSEGATGAFAFPGPASAPKISDPAAAAPDTRNAACSDAPSNSHTAIAAPYRPDTELDE